MPREKKAPTRLDAAEAASSSFFLAVPRDTPGNVAEPPEEKVDEPEETVEEEQPPPPDPPSYAHLSDPPELLQRFLSQSNLTVPVALGQVENLPFHVGDITLKFAPIHFSNSSPPETPPDMFTQTKEAWIYVNQWEQQDKSALYFEWPDKPLKGKTSKAKVSPIGKVKKANFHGPSCVFRMFVIMDPLPLDLWQGKWRESSIRKFIPTILLLTRSRVIVFIVNIQVNVRLSRKCIQGSKGRSSYGWS